MQTVNHQVWEKLARFYQKAAWVTVVAILMGIMSMLVVSAYQEVEVYYNGTCQTVGAYDGDPQLIMEKAGIDPDTKEYEMVQTETGLVLQVGPVLSHTLTVDGQTVSFASRTHRVSAMLEQLNVSVGQNDLVTPAMDTIVTEDTHIVVQRVVYRVRTVEETVSPVVVYEDTDTMPQGTVRVKVPGVDGLSQVTYYETVIDGQVAHREARSTKELQSAEDRIVLRGTAPAEDFAPVITNNAELNDEMVSPLQMETAIEVNEQGQPLNYKKCIKGLATAYNEGPNGITATGDKAQVGYVAVDPDVIPYGTMMYIKTTDGSYFYGVAKASDTGGFTSGPVDVDLFFNTRAECIQFGVRDVEIYIL